MASIHDQVAQRIAYVPNKRKGKPRLHAPDIVTWAPAYHHRVHAEAEFRLEAGHQDSQFGTLRWVFIPGQEPFLVLEILKIWTYAFYQRPGNVQLELKRQKPGQTEMSVGWARIRNARWRYVLIRNAADGWFYLIPSEVLAAYIYNMAWVGAIRGHKVPYCNNIVRTLVPLEGCDKKLPAEVFNIEARFIVALPGVLTCHVDDPELHHPDEVPDDEVQEVLREAAAEFDGLTQARMDQAGRL
jgi:hypothetical protein